MQYELILGYIIEASCTSLANLRTIIFSPYMQHEYTGNEQQRHDQDWNWATKK